MGFDLVAKRPHRGAENYYPPVDTQNRPLMDT